MTPKRSKKSRCRPKIEKSETVQSFEMVWKNFPRGRNFWFFGGGRNIFHFYHRAKTTKTRHFHVFKKPAHTHRGVTRPEMDFSTQIKKIPIFRRIARFRSPSHYDATNTKNWVKNAKIAKKCPECAYLTLT